MQLGKFATVLSVTAVAMTTFLTVPASATSETSEAPSSHSVLTPIDTSGLIEISTPELVEAYGYASTYVQESRLAWEAGFDESYWSLRSEELLTRYNAAQHDLEAKREMAEEAEAQYEESRKKLAAWVRQDHQGSMGLQLPVGAEAFMGGADSMRQMQNEHTAREALAQSRANDFAQAEADQVAAQEALDAVDSQSVLLHTMADESEGSLTQARSATETASVALDDARIAWGDTYRALNTTDSTIGPRLIQRAVVEEWNTYLKELTELGIDIPTAEELSHTSTYPEGLTPVPAMHISGSLGVALHGDVVVPSQESILRTSQALRQLGIPYSPAGNGEEAWGCLPFTQNALGRDTSMENLYYESGRQNKTLLDTQAGDVVFLADPNAGIHQAGVFVFGGFFISASAPAGEVTVNTVSVDALRSVRPGLEPISNIKAPQASEDALDWHCGGIEGDIQEVTEGWTLPVSGDYEIGAEFNNLDERFGGEKFTGTEFVTAGEETVHSIFRGTVTGVQEDPLWGTTLTITHSDNLESQYAFLGATTVTEGQEVTSGTIIGTTGNSGEYAHHPHTVALFMKTSSGYTDPIEALLSPLQGQYQNGRIPTEALCRISVSNGLLRCDAARSFEILAEAYEADFGESIQLTDTYRTLEGQIRCTAQKGNMCATPGTSNHGWGLAIDFSGGINSFGTPQHQWMRENAPKYGWHHPAWARTDGSKPEPWHWEYDSFT